ncbi:MAG: hypothetical protein LBV71_16085 [Prevotella sp.]|jgi:hypothetical protein|nr:hypothetical protein [Prevotella sp.]
MKDLFCEDGSCDISKGKLCIRRVIGALGFIAFIGCIYLGIYHPSVDLLAMLSASLIGLTTVDKFIKK